MKKSFFYAGILAAGLMTVSTSCSKDEEIINGGNEVVEAAAQEIVLQVTNGGDGLKTKAGRPLLSSEAKQSIDKVCVFVINANGVNKNKIVAKKIFENWNTASTIYDNVTDGHGRKDVWRLTGDDKLDANTQYRIYAVGYSSDSDYDGLVAMLEETMTVGSNFTSTDKTFLTTAIQNIKAEEIFAGDIASIETGEGGEFKEEDVLNKKNVLTLRRQVAGSFAYVTGIPVRKATETTEVDADGVKNLTLRLVSSNANEVIAFTKFNQNFTTTGENVQYVVNGASAGSGLATITKNGKFSDAVNNGGDGYILYQTNLGEWFPLGDTNKDGYLDEKDEGWNTPASVLGANLLDGTVFIGNFIIPFVKAAAGVQTLELQVVRGSEIIRTWNIRLPQDDSQINKDAGHVQVIDHSTGEFNPEFHPWGEDALSYSMVRNHLYSIGRKDSDDGEGGTDEPEDLSKGQNLILQVNDNWELIHQMEVE